ncbi:MAG TPA: hypothetical protein VF665_04700 [Longimicrobium sp.]|jgi:hypothetical protein|uniref:hypothetical protein n=1 Tax=Longimicrobium sp. TaxID=2029185 RepID=UPI002EDAF745
MRLRPALAHAVFAGLMAAAPPAAAQTTPLTLDASTLASLQARLDRFAGGLPAEERALWNGVLLRAASAPAGGAEVRVLPILQIGPGGGCDGQGVDDRPNRVGIIIQGGRANGSGIIIQGGRTASTPGGRSPAGVRPGSPGDVRRPTDAVSIGPKQEDPVRPAPEMLGRRLTDLSAQLPAPERGALEWLLTRAAQAPEGRPATPGGLPPGAAVSSAPAGRSATPGGRPSAAVARPSGQPGPGGLPAGTSVSLRQALGIDAVSIGPKQEDPTRGPPRSVTQWTLRY